MKYRVVYSRQEPNASRGWGECIEALEEEVNELLQMDYENWQVRGGLVVQPESINSVGFVAQVLVDPGFDSSEE